MASVTPGENVSFSVLPEAFDREDFLRNYWQKKPLLIRGNSVFVDPVEPDELAGLACEDFIESRLVLSDATGRKWTLRNGPFSAKDFSRLPDTHWSLLIQAVDQWHEGVRSLLHDFAFIPGWRIDDIMISYATDGGGVGPHFDYYDVFLIQGLGRKRWRLGGHADSSSPLLPGTDLRLLETFTTEQDWIVEPGDILYLPPNLAHHGTAIGDSITYSVGFRTPSIAEIIDDMSSELMQELREDQRYVDTAPVVPRHSGEITPQIGEQLITLLQNHVLDKERMMRWFGRYMTSPKYPELVAAPERRLDSEDLLAMHRDGIRLLRNPSSRLAFSDGAQGPELFADGNAIPCPPALADLLPGLCDVFTADQDWAALFDRGSDGLALLVQLYNQGSLLPDVEDQEDDD